MISPRTILRRHRGLALAALAFPLAWLGFERAATPRPRVSWSEIIKADPTRTDDPARQALFAPDSRSVALCEEGRLALRDLSTGRLVELASGELAPGHPAPLRLINLRYLERGRLLLGWMGDAVGHGDHSHSLRVWDAESGRELFRALKVGKDSAQPNFVVSDDGSTLAYPPAWPWGSVGPKEVGVWNRARGPKARTFPGVGPIAISADGKTLAVTDPGASASSLLVHDVETGRRLATLPVAPDVAVRDLALSPDGKILAENRMPRVSLWDVATATARCELASKAYPTRFGPDGKLLILGNVPNDQEDCEVWDLAGDPPRKIFQGLIAGVAPDGRSMIRNGPNRVDSTPPPREGFGVGTQVVELPSLKPLSRTTYPYHQDYVYSPDGKTRAVQSVRSPGSWMTSLLRNFAIRHARFLLRFWVPTDPEVKCVWINDTTAGRPLGVVDLPDGEDVVSQYSLLPDGKTLALHHLAPAPGGVRSTVELWDATNPPREARTPYLVLSAPLILAAGLGFDLWSGRRGRRRAPSSPGPAPAPLPRTE